MEFQQQQKPAGDGKVVYPPGVKEITDKISNDEVVKRLKVRALYVSTTSTNLGLFHQSYPMNIFNVYKNHRQVPIIYQHLRCTSHCYDSLFYIDCYHTLVPRLFYSRECYAVHITGELLKIVIWWNAYKPTLASVLQGAD